MATKLWYGFEHIPSNTEITLKKFLSSLKKLIGDDSIFVYLDNEYDYKNANKELLIKISNQDTIDKIVKSLKLYKFKKKDETFISTNLVNVKLYKTGGVRGTGRLPRKGETLRIPSNPEHEMGTIIYFREKFKNKTATLKQISDEVGFNFDSLWYWSFEQQYEAFEKNMGKFPKSNIYLDSGKNDSNIITEIAKRVGLKDRKDNWNPSDMWIFNITKQKIISETSEISTLEEFNDYLTDKFHKREIIGVSLKKVEKNKKGKYSEVSKKNFKKVKLEPKRVIFDPYQKNFVFETKGTVDGFNIRVGYKASTIRKESDINIYMEGRQSGTKVQMGAVSSMLFPEISLQYGKFNMEKDKKEILKNPRKFMEDNLIKIKSNSVVEYKDGKHPISQLADKSAAWLTYYLKILLESDNEILNKCYYSSSKLNDTSSIHCKLY